jgi:thymidine phosphorylase
MAVFFRGMTPNETQNLTAAMMQSGRVLAISGDSPPKVDKHSTGGIGDKVSLVLAPLLACDEVWVPMISGRGPRHYRRHARQTREHSRFQRQPRRAPRLAAARENRRLHDRQTADICPADKKLYALRDVTGTVPSQPLIVASIMSKKLAENLDQLVLDVKFGSGAFMKTREEAAQLAESMTTVGNGMGVKVSHLVSPMDEPLGHAVGNALEVAEAVENAAGRRA